MEEILATDAIRERLIIAGIRELEAHGLNDFSLRRVAVACEVSCAAPYRHFRSKEDLILEIIRYINRQWTLLQSQIIMAFPNDRRRCLSEIAIAHIRFWIANPKFRSILLLEDNDPKSPRHIERHKISEGMETRLFEYCLEKGITCNEEQESLSYAFCSLIYGTVLLLGNQELENSDKTIRMIRTRIDHLLP